MNEHFKDCYARFDGATLKIGNSGIERIWDLAENGAPIALSIKDKFRNMEWVEPSPFKWAFRRNALPLSAKPEVTFNAATDDYLKASEKHLLVAIRLVYPNAELEWRHQIWPELPIVLSRYEIRERAAAPTAEPEKKVDSGRLHVHPTDDRIEHFGVAPLHLAYRIARFVAKTDHHDNLVKEQSGVAYNKEDIREKGHYLHLLDRASGNGLLALKIGAPDPGHLHYPGYDFALTGKTLAIAGTGVTDAEIHSGERCAAYASAVGVTDGDEQSGKDLFYRLDRKRSVPVPERNFKIMSNTWGDGNCSKEICESMMFEEIATGARIGLTHCQLDAGWMKGAFRDLFVEANKPKSAYEVDPNFWSVNPEKFPNGFGPMVAFAREKGVRLGLWFNPDNTNDYANWEKDAETVLAFHRQHGFDTIKIDGVAVLTKRAEKNYFNFLRKLYLDSEGKLCVNFDITAGIRPGHIYGHELTGNLFVENRYALDSTYYPFRTLRNLWRLAAYIPSYRLHMEFVNVRSRCDNYDATDPLRPEIFGTEFSCAAVLFSNPLCWMETRNLSESDKRALEKLLKAYRPFQRDILLGRVYPIGEEPLGRSWTGFQSVADAKTGYLGIYREATDRGVGEFKLFDVKPGDVLKITKIAGQGSVKTLKVDKTGAVKVKLPKPCSYLLARYEIAN